MTRSTRSSRMRMTLALAGGTAILGAGIGAASLANAEPTASPTAPSSTATATPDDHGSGPERGPGAGAKDSTLAKSLAEKLGLDETTVSEALDAAREENRPDKPAEGEKPTERPDPVEHRAALARTLAEKLGVDEAKVTTALTEIDEARQAERTAALKTRLDQAVTAGTLTRAEADAVLKAAEAGVIQAGGGPRR